MGKSFRAVVLIILLLALGLRLLGNLEAKGPNLAIEVQQRTGTLDKTDLASLPTVSEADLDVTKLDINKLRGNGHDALDVAFIRVALTGEGLDNFLQKNPNLINALNGFGIFVVDSKGNLLGGQRYSKVIETAEGEREIKYFVKENIAFAVDVKNHMVFGLDPTKVVFAEIGIVLQNPLVPGDMILTIDGNLLSDLIRKTGGYSDSFSSITRYFEKAYGTVVSRNRKVYEKFVQYGKIFNDKGEEGLCIVSGQGMNMALIGGRALVGKGFDLYDIKTLATNAEYAKTARENGIDLMQILTNTQLMASVFVNVAGSWMKNHGQLEGAPAELLDLLNYDVSKMPSQGFEFKNNNGKWEMVPLDGED